MIMPTQPISAENFHALYSINCLELRKKEKNKTKQTKQRKTLCFPLFLNLISMLYIEHTNDA